ncbi:UNVERIFIED_ORG: hypothetical protein QQG_3855, partial [Clostridioides difficile Y384]
MLTINPIILLILKCKNKSIMSITIVIATIIR